MAGFPLADLHSLLPDAWADHQAAQQAASNIGANATWYHGAQARSPPSIARSVTCVQSSLDYRTPDEVETLYAAQAA